MIRNIGLIKLIVLVETIQVILTINTLKKVFFWNLQSNILDG